MGQPEARHQHRRRIQARIADARSIAYLKVGSGIYLEGLFERLASLGRSQSKTIRPDSDIVSELVAKGDVEIGMTVITQILTTPGVELVGPLPADIQSYITFVAGIGTRSKVAGAAAELIEFLTGPRAASVIQKQGMEVPGAPSIARSVVWPDPRSEGTSRGDEHTVARAQLCDRRGVYISDRAPRPDRREAAEEQATRPNRTCSSDAKRPPKFAGDTRSSRTSESPAICRRSAIDWWRPPRRSSSNPSTSTRSRP